MTITGIFYYTNAFTSLLIVPFTKDGLVLPAVLND